MARSDPSAKTGSALRSSRFKWFLAIFAALGLVLALAVLLVTLSFLRILGVLPQATRDIRFSADGLPFRVITVAKPRGIFFVEIRDGVTDQPLARSYDANQMRWSLTEDQGHVWFYSADIGTYLFAREGGTWQCFPWAPAEEKSKNYPMPRKVFETISPSLKPKILPYVRAKD